MNVLLLLMDIICCYIFASQSTDFGFRPFTVVPLFHPCVYRKFSQNLQGILNSRIKILKPRLYFFILFFESKIYFPKVENRFKDEKLKIVQTKSQELDVGVHYS